MKKPFLKEAAVATGSSRGRLVVDWEGVGGSGSRCEMRGAGGLQIVMMPSSSSVDDPIPEQPYAPLSPVLFKVCSHLSSLLHKFQTYPEEQQQDQLLILIITVILILGPKFPGRSSCRCTTASSRRPTPFWILLSAVCYFSVSTAHPPSPTLFFQLLSLLLIFFLKKTIYVVASISFILQSSISASQWSGLGFFRIIINFLYITTLYSWFLSFFT